MLNEMLSNIKVGDCVYLNRPIYNDSDELFQESKLVRPYIVLEIFDDSMLVVSVTSNGRYYHNVHVALNSYVRINDLYLVSSVDLIGKKYSLSCNEKFVMIYLN